MQPGLMKTLGILLLAAGIVVCASAGVQFGSEEYAAVVADGRAALGAAPAMAPADSAKTAAERIVAWYAVAGMPFAAGLLLLIAGAVIGRVAIRRDAAADGEGDGADFVAGLERLAAGIDECRNAADAADAEPAAIRHEIERLQQDILEPMIEARASLQRHFGLAGYAAVLGPMSGAERLLNRAWSALVDGHMAEGRASLGGALAEAEAAGDALRVL